MYKLIKKKGCFIVSCIILDLKRQITAENTKASLANSKSCEVPYCVLCLVLCGKTSTVRGM